MSGQKILAVLQKHLPEWHVDGKGHRWTVGPVESGTGRRVHDGESRVARLCTRYRRLSARGKTANVVNVAIAREMVGFIWSIACTVQSAPKTA